MTKQHHLEPEPSIEEMLADPIVQLLMKRDGLCPGDIRAIWAEAASRLNDPKGETPSKAA